MSVAGQAALKHDLSARELFSLAFGAIVGVSWIVLVGQWIADAGSAGAMLAFLIGGLLMLPIGQIYAELGQRLPATGGEFVYAYRFFGAKAAFGVAWVLSLFYMSVCAFEAVSAAWTVSAIVPAIKGPLLYSVAGKPLFLGDLVLGGTFTIGLAWLQLRGAQMAAQVQDYMVFALIALVAIFIAGALWSGNVANTAPLLGNDAGKFLALLLATPLFYAGFGSVPQALGESSEAARRTLPRVIFIVLIASMIFKIGVILATALVLSPSEGLAAEFPVAAAFERAFHSPIVAKIALFTGVLGLLTTWNSALFSASRVMFAMGNGGLGPASLGVTESRHGVPRFAVLIVAGVTLVAIPFGKPVLIPVITLGGIAVTLMFALVSICLLALRREQGRTILLPAFGTFISLGLLGLNIYQLAVLAMTGRLVEVMVLALWIVSGILLWLGSRRTRGAMTDADRARRIVGERAA